MPIISFEEMKRRGREEGRAPHPLIDGGTIVVLGGKAPPGAGDASVQDQQPDTAQGAAGDAPPAE